MRKKGSISEITAWNPRLSAVVSRCKEFNKNAPVPIAGAYLLHDGKGLPIKQQAFLSAWRRTMNKWSGEHFTFHDLKAAGYSDQKKQEAGHRSPRMHDVYNRKLQIVEPAE